MKLRTKLYVGFGSILVIFLLLGIMFLFFSNRQQEHLNEIVKTNYERVKISNEIKSNTKTLALENREILLRKEVNHGQINDIRGKQRRTLELLGDLKGTEIEDLETREILVELEEQYYVYTYLLDQLIEYIVANDFTSGTSLLLEEVQNQSKYLISQINQLTDRQETLMYQSFSQSEEAYRLSIIVVSILLVGCFLITMLITIYVIKSISRSINRIKDVITNIPSHFYHELPKIDVRTNDELGEIARAYNYMASSIEKLAQQEKFLTDSLKNDNWVKTNLTEIVSTSQELKCLEEYTGNIIQIIARKVNANFGLIFLKEEDHLNELAYYATGKKNKARKSLKLGHGLVGQCALDKKPLLLKNAPQSYITIESGVGKATASSIAIYPIFDDKEVIGILELAKFEEFSSRELQLLEQVCQFIGASLSEILDNMKIEELLTESQALTEELQTQSEELKQQQEELKTINEKLHEQNTQYVDKTKELEKIKLDLEERNRGIKLASQYKSEFLANMSHELRTPLNSMLVLAQMLSENSGHNLTDSQVSYANTIYSSGQDLLFLINDILDLSKIESGKLSIYPEEIFVSDIKGYVIDQFTPISSRKGINFSVKIEDSTPSIIYTDDQRIKQILKNLLANAFKFTEEGEVELIIKEGKGGNDSKVQFIVKDTGIGISESKVKDIFEEFYQADGTTTRKFGGTGLGLPISQNLSRLLGGYIEVESMEGEGSVFILHIPDYVLNSYDELDEVSATILKKVDSNKENKNEIKMLNNKPQGNKEKLDITIDHLKNKTVLIVDDDMRNVFAMTTALEAQGMMVLFAENGQEAIDVLEINSQIDIVLMDMMMPIMDGYEAMKRIRRNVKFKELPIIALTAKAMKHDKEKCIEAGASDYISKPVDVRRLISVLKVWICE